MKDQILELAGKVDALSLRERALLFGAVLILIFTLWNELLMIPLEEKHARALSEIESVQKRVKMLDGQIKSSLTMLKNDPNKLNRKAQIQLDRELSRIDQQIADLANNLIPPREMAKVLEEMLSNSLDLKLLRVESLAARPLLESGADAPEGAGEAALGIFRHGMIIEFEGEFHQTLDYLRALEGLPWRLFWEHIDYSVEQHPKAHITIGVSTLSLQEGWIGV